MTKWEKIKPFLDEIIFDDISLDEFVEIISSEEEIPCDLCKAKNICTIGQDSIDTCDFYIKKYLLRDE